MTDEHFNDAMRKALEAVIKNEHKRDEKTEEVQGKKGGEAP